MLEKKFILLSDYKSTRTTVAQSSPFEVNRRQDQTSLKIFWTNQPRYWFASSFIVSREHEYRRFMFVSPKGKGNRLLR